MKADERIKIILMQDAAADTLRRLGAPPPLECCVRCEHLADDELCVKWKQKVPAEYLGTSCDQFVDFIPF